MYHEGGNGRYEFNIRDHLGNTRLTFTDKDGDGIIEISDDVETTEVLQENHYYPFGMSMDGQWMANAGREDKYQYNGKELHDDFGLGWYAYGARFYDPAIGRFTGVDPIADRFPWVSTYNYAENEPIANIDLWGLQAYSFQIARDALDNPNGVGAHLAGVSKGLMGTIQGTVDAVLNPVSTAKGIWNALTNPEETAASIREGVSEIAYNLVSGDGFERGEAIYEVGTVVVAELKAGKLSKLGKLDTPGSVISETVRAINNNKPIRNKHLANKKHPKTGVPFDETGFPDFSNYLYEGGINDVKIKLTGNRAKDFDAANKAAGYKSKPKGYTWHHHQNIGRMQLVEEKIHAKTGHTGGHSLNKE